MMLQFVEQGRLEERDVQEPYLLEITPFGLA